MGTLADHTSSLPAAPSRSWPPELRRDAHAIRRILVCLDDSPRSEGCVPQAVSIARSLGGTITLLHVMQPPLGSAGDRSMDVLDWELARQEASAYLERIERRASEASGRPVAVRLEQGHPADRIAAVALELEADLTVLGAEGERDVGAWSLGSTVMRVLARTRGSILVARRGPAVERDAPPRRVLVPLDGSLRSESVLPTVARIAAAHEAEVLLAFAVVEPKPSAVLRTPADLAVARDLASRLEASGKGYLEGLRDQLVREGVRARTRVVRAADERHSIIEVGRRERSDLIVLCAHGATCNPTLSFGSFTAHLLMHSSVPLLVLQDLRDSELPARDGSRRAPKLRATFPEGS